MLKVTRCEFVHNLPCEQLSGRLTELEAENAKMRNDLEDANNQAEEVCIENAKLRELLIDLKCAPCCGDSCWLHLPERLRELGIEVDE